MLYSLQRLNTIYNVYNNTRQNDNRRKKEKDVYNI